VFRICAAVLIALTACTAVRADLPNLTNPKAPDTKSEPVRLDFKSLGEMLTDLGFDPKPSDNTYQQIRATRKDNSSSIWLMVSGNQKILWMYTEFSLPEGYEKAPASVWQKLLEMNDDIGPVQFSIDGKDRRLILRKPVHNDGITSVMLRKEIDSFMDVISKNQVVWAYGNFLPVMSIAEKKLLAELSGTWQVIETAQAGKSAPAENVAKLTLVFENGKLTINNDGKPMATNDFHIQMKNGAIWFDFVNQYGSEVGILKLEGDELTLCINKVRPSEFESTEKNGNTLTVLKRKK